VFCVLLLLFIDCYVAVTGCPDVREDHALVMTKFARDMLQCLEKMLRKLAPTLGEDTLNLAMRVGMHSGPVTGKKAKKPALTA
jgi:class 3 adenylate cyclase